MIEVVAGNITQLPQCVLKVNYIKALARAETLSTLTR